MRVHFYLRNDRLDGAVGKEFMLPDSASKSKDSGPFSLLLSQISENSTYYNECLEQLNHASSCRKDNPDFKCDNHICSNLQLDL